MKHARNHRRYLSAPIGIEARKRAANRSQSSTYMTCVTAGHITPEVHTAVKCAQSNEIGIGAVQKAQCITTGTGQIMWSRPQSATTEQTMNAQRVTTTMTPEELKWWNSRMQWGKKGQHLSAMLRKPPGLCTSRFFEDGQGLSAQQIVTLPTVRKVFEMSAELILAGRSKRPFRHSGGYHVLFHMPCQCLIHGETADTARQPAERKGGKTLARGRGRQARKKRTSSKYTKEREMGNRLVGVVAGRKGR